MTNDSRNARIRGDHRRGGCLAVGGRFDKKMGEKMNKLARSKKPRSIPEIQLLTHILERELPEPAREFKFHPSRKWRFDFAWPSRKFAVEVEGGTWSRGRHTRGYGFEDDCVKYAEALLLGWTVLRVTPAMINSLYAIETIHKILMAPK